MPKNTKLLALLSLLPLISPVSLLAQESDEEEIVYLSPFVVDTSSDVGYRSSNAISATSLNTEIRDLPMALSVINQELIRDLGASNLEEALAYNAGVFTGNTQASNSVGATRQVGGTNRDRSLSSAGSGSRFANVTYIRGLAVPFQNRAGFRYGGLVVTENTAVALGGLIDSANIDRIEVVKGPNSLLYGVGVLTGIVNVIPERPLGEPHYEASLRMGSEDFFRAQVEATGPLIGRANDAHRLNYRLAASYEDRGHWTDFRETNTEYYAAQLDYSFTDKFNLFLEYQDGKTRHEGIGTQWFYDGINGASDSEFRNEYEEAYNWARHNGPIDGLYPIVGYNDKLPVSTGGTLRAFELGDTPFEGGGMHRGYRITGPDTYAERDEWNLIADATLTPFENLSINAGVFLSEQETQELDIGYRSSTGMGNADIHGTAIENLDTADLQLRNIYLSGRMYGHPMQQSVRDAFGINLSPAASVAGSWILPTAIDDVKLTEYWWEHSIIKSESLQYRLRATYTFETPFLFDTTARHTILAGYSYINDKVDFPDGPVDAGNAAANRDRLTDTNNYNNDGLYYRSIANFSPLYFNGSNDDVNGHSVVRAGDVYLRQDITQEGLYAVYNGKLFNDRLDVILGVRRDSYNADEFIHKRLDRSDADLIAGADSLLSNQLMAEVKQLFRVANQVELDAHPDASAYFGEQFARRSSGNSHVPAYYRSQVEGGVGYFESERYGAPDAHYGVVPGSARQLFERDVTETTGTFGASYELLPGKLNIYGVYSEGLTPNTALRGGQGEILPAESTTNMEVGIKFDLIEDKLSGSLAFFKIDRENAIMDVPRAPNPAKWFDAIAHPNRDRNFSSDAVTYDPESPSVYYVRQDFFNAYMSEALGFDISKVSFESRGIADDPLRNRVAQQINPADIERLPGESNTDYRSRINAIRDAAVMPIEFVLNPETAQQFGGSFTVPYIGVPVDGLDGVHTVSLYNPETGELVTADISSLPILYGAFNDRAIDRLNNNLLQNIESLKYRRLTADGVPQKNNNPDFDQARRTLVTFDEEILGAEVEFTYTPTRNLQMVFSYAYTERKGQDSFNFSNWQSIADPDRAPYVAPFTLLHREYGWEAAGIRNAWVDSNAYLNAKALANGEAISVDALDSAALEFRESADAEITNQEFAQRLQAGQTLIFVDKEGKVINASNPSRASDFEGLVDGISLNFNPQHEAALWSRYRFSEGPLSGLSLNLGVKYVGESETSVVYRSLNPLAELSETPSVADYFSVDLGAQYEFEWLDLGWRISLNVYNLFEHTYDVTTTTLSTPNPITGKEITKRTERWYAPRSYRLGVAVRF